MRCTSSFNAFLLPQRNFSHYVHVIDLRKVQRARDGRGHHHLQRTATGTDHHFQPCIKLQATSGLLCQTSYNDDLHWNREGQLVAVACTQLLHHDQDQTAD